MHQIHPPREEGSPPVAPVLPLPPRDGAERLAWFEQLDTAIAIDCLGIAARLLAHDATGAEVEDELKHYRSWIAARTEAAVDRYLASLSLHAYEAAA